MSTTVFVNTYTYSVNHVSDKMLKSFKTIIQESGLNPTSFVENLEVINRGIVTWLGTQHLEAVELEIYDASTDELVNKWVLNVHYHPAGDDGGFTEDPDAIRAAIIKAGKTPSRCKYRVLANTRDGRPDVAGWSPTTARSTQGMIWQSVGTSAAAPDIRASAGFWRQS